jgi:membrane protein
VIARDFLERGPRRSAAALADLLEVPPQLVEEVLDALTRAGVVARAVFGREIAWVPGGDVDEIRVDDLREALRRDPDAGDVREAVARQLGPELERILREVDLGRVRGEGGLTMRDLAACVGEASGPRPPRRRPLPAPAERAENGGNGGDVVDAKQPDLPP